MMDNLYIVISKYIRRKKTGFSIYEKGKGMEKKRVGLFELQLTKERNFFIKNWSFRKNISRCKCRFPKILIIEELNLNINNILMPTLDL